MRRGGKLRSSWDNDLSTLNVHVQIKRQPLTSDKASYQGSTQCLEFKSKNKIVWTFICLVWIPSMQYTLTMYSTSKTVLTYKKKTWLTWFNGLWGTFFLLLVWHPFLVDRWCRWHRLSTASWWHRSGIRTAEQCYVSLTARWLGDPVKDERQKNDCKVSYLSLLVMYCQGTYYDRLLEISNFTMKWWKVNQT